MLHRLMTPALSCSGHMTEMTIAHSSHDTVLYVRGRVPDTIARCLVHEFRLDGVYGCGFLALLVPEARALTYIFGVISFWQDISDVLQDSAFLKMIICTTAKRAMLCNSGKAVRKVLARCPMFNPLLEPELNAGDVSHCSLKPHLRRSLSYLLNAD